MSHVKNTLRASGRHRAPLYSGCQSATASIGFFFILFVVFHPMIVSAQSREIALTGKTMGTLYQVKIIVDKKIDRTRLKKKIDARLESINQSMSPYIPTSEISRFNHQTRTGQSIIVSGDFWRVMGVAKRIHTLTAGAWDGTIAPLVNLWGFGSEKRVDRIPSNTEIERLLQRIGFDLIHMGDDRHLLKKKPHVTLDLASIAKGYGVDAVAELIQTMGFHRYLVEIGGETYASGRRLDGGFWRVGINRPDRDAPFDAVYKVVSLYGQALATSGDYRNYFEVNGKYYSHVLDPRTGYPVTNSVVAVSVLADNCTWADGLATGIMVMGVEKGLALANRLPGVECLIITRTPNGALKDHPSSAFLAENFKSP